MARAEVYWNLHRKMWTLRDAKTKRVVCHAPSVSLSDVEFRVQPAGRERVRREGRKNVHAYAVGNVCKEEAFLSDCLNQNVDSVRYNPYDNETFVDGDGAPVRRANYAHFYETRDVIASEPRS